MSLGCIVRQILCLGFGTLLIFLVLCHTAHIHRHDVSVWFVTCMIIRANLLVFCGSKIVELKEESTDKYWKVKTYGYQFLS